MTRRERDSSGRQASQPPDILHPNRLATFSFNVIKNFDPINGPAYFHHSQKRVACGKVASIVATKILFLEEDNCGSVLLFLSDYICCLDVMLIFELH